MITIFDQNAFEEEEAIEELNTLAKDVRNNAQCADKYGYAVFIEFSNWYQANTGAAPQRTVSNAGAKLADCLRLPRDDADNVCFAVNENGDLICTLSVYNDGSAYLVFRRLLCNPRDNDSCIDAMTDWTDCGDLTVMNKYTEKIGADIVKTLGIEEENNA